MKISLYGKHWGLVSHLRDILEKDHEVSVVEAKSFPAQFNLIESKFAPDVHISTFPYDDIKFYDKKTPLIVYATDPVYAYIFEEMKEIQKWGGCTVVVAEPCFHQEYWPISFQHEIPFAIDPSKYHEWTGGIHRVAVVNRKARERWNECVRGATGIGYSLEEFLGDIPFDVVQIDDNEEYRKKLSEYDVLFYFSNSPYTLVMFEAMGIGMPMVGFNHHQLATYKPIERYLKDYSTHSETIKTMLKAKLNEPKKETYPVQSFDTIREKWGLVINEACAKFKRL
jgi:hypothetical protein